MIEAKAVTVGSYSAHADQSGLLRFVEGIPCWPGNIILEQGGQCRQNYSESSIGAARCEQGLRLSW
ncbi:MBL fold metallo-hydrolase RNA specificity domain-containing protein [Pseudomonas mosselii]|uniref:MBL fold metallo-hydrolase RNA specificity domain-containing protein n=1 Tax=Pseudomonas mosselii TaxID=78327 RepID=UPI003F397EAD